MSSKAKRPAPRKGDIVELAREKPPRVAVGIVSHVYSTGAVEVDWVIATPRFLGFILGKNELIVRGHIDEVDDGNAQKG